MGDGEEAGLVIAQKARFNNLSRRKESVRAREAIDNPWQKPPRDRTTAPWRQKPGINIGCGHGVEQANRIERCEAIVTMRKPMDSCWIVGYSARLAKRRMPDRY